MLKKAVKYQATIFGKVIMIYYAVMLVILTVAMYFINTIAGGGSIVGMEGVTIVAMFVLGVVAYESDFRMFLQNGISRATVLISYVITITGMAVIMAVVSKITTMILQLYFEYDSAFGVQVYMGSNLILKFIGGFLTTVFSYIIAAMLGCFISILYYRMSKKLRVIVFLGVPALFVGISKSEEHNGVSSAIYESIIDAIVYVIKFRNGYNAYLVAIVDLIILGALSYGLIRKSVIKTS